MQVKFNVQDLVKPAMRVLDICALKDCRNNAPVMIKVDADKLTLLGCNTNIQLKAQIALNEGDVKAEGTVLIDADNARDLFSKVKKTAGYAEFILDNDILQVKTDSAKYKFKVLDQANDHPYIEAEGDFNSFFLEENKLHYMLTKSMFCVSAENFRDYLQGVRFEVNSDKLDVIALDGYRMAVLSTKLTKFGDEQIYKSIRFNCAQTLSKVLNAKSDSLVELKFNDDVFEAKVGVYTLTSRLIRCVYPNVRAALPKEVPTEITVSTKQLKTGIKNASDYTDSRLNGIKFNFENCNLNLTASNDEYGSCSINMKASYESDSPITLTLNAELLKDVIGAINTPNVVFGFAPPYNIVVVTPDSTENELGIKSVYVVCKITF